MIALTGESGPPFIDRAADWGLSKPIIYGNAHQKDFILETTGTGAAIFDVDNDGRNDLLILLGTTLDAKPGDHPGALLYRNLGEGRFEDVAKNRGLTANGWAQAACAADFDNDGHTDLLVTYYGVNRLYRNTAGRFEDVTRRSGLPFEGTRWGAGCAFTDYDRDGFVDLFVSNYVDLDLKTAPRPGSRPECIWKGMPVMCGPVGLPLAKNALYRNRGDGTFEDVSAKAGILKPDGRYGLGVVAADFNNDGWPDIYVACDQTPSLLYQNKRDGTFVERGVEAGVAYNVDGRLQAGMGVAVADVDGNGFLDIAKTNFSGDLPSLYLNEDGSFFRDAAREAGLGTQQLLGWGAAFVDIDEDTWPDLVMANGHVYPEVDRANLGEKYRQLTLLFRNQGKGKFADWTAKSGPAFATPRPSRGLATGDLDGDGRPEIVVVNMNEPPAVIRNQSPRGNWVRFSLTGAKSNRSAVGARVVMTTSGRTQISEVMSGGSYYSQNELALYFGAGAARIVDKLEVRWPSGLVQSWTGLAVNSTFSITEGRKEVTRK